MHFYTTMKFNILALDHAHTLHIIGNTKRVYCKGTYYKTGLKSASCNPNAPAKEPCCVNGIMRVSAMRKKKHSKS